MICLKGHVPLRWFQGRVICHFRPLGRQFSCRHRLEASSSGSFLSSYHTAGQWFAEKRLGSGEMVEAVRPRLEAFKAERSSSWLIRPSRPTTGRPNVVESGQTGPENGRWTWSSSHLNQMVRRTSQCFWFFGLLRPMFLIPPSLLPTFQSHIPATCRHAWFLHNQITCPPPSVTANAEGHHEVCRWSSMFIHVESSMTWLYSVDMEGNHIRPSMCPALAELASHFDAKVGALRPPRGKGHQKLRFRSLPPNWSQLADCLKPGTDAKHPSQHVVWAT